MGQVMLVNKFYHELKKNDENVLFFVDDKTSLQNTNY